MILFRVIVEGSELQMIVDGVTNEVGFMKCEYILAFSRDKAEHAALHSIGRALEKMRQNGGIKYSATNIRATEVTESINYINLFRKSGFVFYSK